MNNLTTQRQTIIKLLQDAGNAGISSFAFTFTYNIKQAPTRVHELKKLGFNILSKPYKNTVIYILSNEPIGQVREVTKPLQQWQIEQEQSEVLVSYEKNGRIYYDTPENVAKRQRGEQLSF